MIMLAVLLLVIMSCIFTLRSDNRMRRINRHVAVALGDDAIVVDTPQTIRPKQQAQWALRLLFNYNPSAPRFWTARRVFVTGAIIGLVAMGLTVAMFSLLLGIIIGCIVGCIAVRMLFAWQTQRYVDRLLRQLPDVIETVVGIVRSGLPVTEAFRLVATDMDGPSKDQFEQVVGDLALAHHPHDAVRAIYDRTRVDEYALFAVTLAIQNRSGGRLAETLQTLGDTVRERIALAGRAKALAGEARLSARVLACVPFVAGTGMYIERPAALDLLFHDPRGQIMLAFGIGSLILGIFTMRHMIRKGTTV